VATPQRTIPIPDGVPFEKALVYSFNMPAAYLVYYNFVSIAPDSTVLMHSGAGGFSSMLTRIAKRAGNRVISLVSDEHKRQACLDAGADEVIVTSKHDYADEVLRLTDGRGVDVIINHRGGPTLQADLKCMTFRAKWIFSNVTEGFDGADWSLMNLVYNKCPIISIAASANLYGTEEHQQALQFLHDWLRDEDVEGPSRTFSLDDLADAHRWLESGESTGKIAIIP
jgi:NADPH2:quinone reductase